MVAFSSLAALASALALTSALPAAEPNFSIDTSNANADTAKLVARARTPNYTQNYKASGASVTFTPNQSAGTFGVNFNTKQDFVVGLGWQPGDKSPITFSGSFSGSGVAILSVYGWSTNPLIEYYVIENPTGYPKQGTKKGTLTSDGATYEIWQHQQTNQPSIQGTTTFQQYISIRTSSRNSGTVTIQNHFDAWAKLGMNLGTLNYQVLAVESWNGQGQGNLKVSK